MAEWVFETRPVVCENHRNIDGTTGRATIGSGMISPERGLICPMCYAEVRYATDDEVDDFNAMVASAKNRTHKTD